MRKFSFLSLCFTALIFISSCTKEKDLPPAGTPPPQQQAPTVTYSDWTEESAFTWSDTLVNAEPHVRSTFSAPGLTQAMIDNEAVLIYGKNSATANVSLFPIIIFDNNSSAFDMYSSSTAVEYFELLHSKTVNGVYEAPTVNSNVSFRYILIDNAPPANGRIATGSAAGFNMDDLKAMSYQDVCTILGIPN